VHLEIAVAIIQRENQVLIARRTKDQHLGGQWEFPGGKIEKDETIDETLIRECREELGIEVDPTSLFHEQQFDYPGRCVHLHFYLCRHRLGLPKAIESDEIRWVEKSKLNEYEFPEANRQALEMLMES
jgi:8-oxo-dGTP diphosphatase